MQSYQGNAVESNEYQIYDYDFQTIDPRRELGLVFVILLK
jgi:hypothetical protein